MIKGVLKFPGYHGDKWFKSQDQYTAYENYKEWTRIREANKQLIQDEIDSQKVLLDEALQKKRERDIAMQEHARKKYQELADRIEEYDVQLLRIQQARDLCMTALSLSKKEACDEYKKQHPVPEVKRLQNKIYALQIKKSRI